ncbi:synapse-associated protein 1-like [Oscarella lobularis]|uniref:synapse-associated protein 1-like n=1 Tax=Oscarella lobularis TaxID=121494 RepID=UPI00331367E7
MWSWWGSKESANAERENETTEAKEEDRNAKDAVSKGLGNIWSAVTSTVEKVTTAVSDTIDSSLLGDLNREQKKFVRQRRSRRADASVPPWVGYNEEEAMKSQILALSSDKRNFLRNPPQGALFHFDFNSSFPIASATLAEDPNLRKMRFELVPKKVTEETFWRNYFYRVSLIKQSTQLTSLTDETEKQRLEEANEEKLQREELKGAATQKPSTDVHEQQSQIDVDEEVAGSPADEFISDGLTHQEGELSQAELGQLGVERTPDAEPVALEEADWEKDLQQELAKFGVKDDEEDAGDDDDDGQRDDGAWEAEIEQMLELDATEQDDK